MTTAAIYSLPLPQLVVVSEGHFCLQPVLNYRKDEKSSQCLLSNIETTPGQREGNLDRSCTSDKETILGRNVTIFNFLASSLGCISEVQMLIDVQWLFFLHRRNN